MTNRLFLLLCALPAVIGAAAPPMPRLSAKKPVFASPESNATALVDGKYGSSWRYAAGAWVAIRVGEGPSKVVVTWNDPTSNWSDAIPLTGVCKGGASYPSAYRILTSSSSTNGSDGTWTRQIAVENSAVSARAHLVPFQGASWIKIEVTGGSGGMDEVEVFDASAGNTDTWFFLGTSISQMTYKSFVPDSNFADLVTARVPGRTPAMVRGGVPCISSTDLANSLPLYLDHMTGLRYVAVEMGTNDAWGGGVHNLPAFKRNLQALIDSVRGRGMEPVLARVLATDSVRANWQIDPGFPRAVDSLRIANRLIEGPDLDGWFRKHPQELGSDGVHPSAAGAQSIQRLWAEAMAKNLYGMPSGLRRPSGRGALRRLPETFDALGRAESPRGALLPVRLGVDGASLEGSVSPK